MIRFRYFLLLLLIWAAPLSAATVLVYGDSLSAGYGLPPGQGWVSLLERRLAPAHRVVNASQSGETSAGGLSRLPATLARHRPDVVVLELGGNDGLRGLPLTELAANLERMVKLSQDAGARVLLVGMALPPNYGPQYGAKFRQVYDELVRRRKLAYVPLLVAGFESRLDAFQPDGIHPRGSAQPLMLDNVLPALTPLLQARARR